MRNGSGFTLLETVVASTIISFTMLGMIGILATHSHSASKSKDATFAANLAQQELDVILANYSVQKSLVSRDSNGRARKSYVYIAPSSYAGATDGSTLGFVMDYYYNNFKAVNHEFPDDGDPNTTRDDPDATGANLFDLQNGNRFYDMNGVYLDAEKSPAGPAVGVARYVTRIQIFAIPQGPGMDNSLPKIEIPSQQMGDTNNGTSNNSISNVIPMRKLVVVRVYDGSDAKNASFDLSTIPPKKELAKMKMVLYGDI